MSRLQQDALFPTVLYFASQNEETAGIESIAAHAGAIVDVWHFDPTSERPLYIGAGNSETARARRVAGALRWESAGVIAISGQLPAERIHSIAEGADHLKKATVLLVSHEAEAGWVAHNRFSPLRTSTALALGELVRTYIEGGTSC